MESAPVVWLAYVSYPVTTAVYFERALRRPGRVVTCGPKIGPDIIEQWHLQNMKLPVLDHDMPLAWEPDMREVCAAAHDRFPAPDLYLWIESVPGYHPTHLEAVRCPKACYLIDSHLNLKWHVQWARLFDFVFIAQREYIEEFRRHGCQNVYWLPLASDSEVNSKRSSEKIIDVGFVGTVVMNTRRSQLLQRIADKNLYLMVGRCFGEDMADLFSKSRIVFNNAVRNDLNMRVFEAMSTGSFLLTDLAKNSAQDELFADGEDLGVYHDENLLDQVRHYLVHEEKRETIARRARKMAQQAHTYAHRCAELLAVCLRSQKSTPSAAEWRERSLAGVEPPSARPSGAPAPPQGRSIVIPVVDASPAGREQLGALLNDLQRIPGEVIVIFNSPDAAALFKEHPRIDHSACLNVNSGVARAWNIGVHLATQPTLFFLNADMRVQRAAVETLEQALWNLPAAAVVGPEGSFFGFYTYEDIVAFRKGQVASPQFVDAVSGFFFATKRELFLRKVLQFENGYTPCLTEEWDLAMQARQAGYRSYAVPVTGYEHEWGVSKDGDRVIRYWKAEQATAREILSRNRIRFWRKWRSAAGELALPQWEPNGPETSAPSGSALLQSRILELTNPAQQKSQAEPQICIRLIEHRDLFPHLLNFFGLLGEGVEIGVQTGLYSEILLKSWLGRRLHSVDPWREWPQTDYADPANVPQAKQDEVFREASQRLRDFGERSAIVRKTSAEAAGDFAGGSLDFVYLDAQHHYEAIRDDIQLWLPKVKRGGFLCGHDYFDHEDIHKICGVRTAVNEFCARQQVQTLVISQRDSSWFVQII